MTAGRVGSSGTYPDSDAELAAMLATAAGRVLVEVREQLTSEGAYSWQVMDSGDLAAQTFLARALHEARPADAVLSEEGAEDPRRFAADRVWIIDPLDGTINYANGIPLFCTSIALVVHGRPVVGVILDPLRDELFSAIAGRGAWLDGAPIVHPAKERLIDCVVAMSLPGRGWALRGRRVRRAVRVARVLGSAALELTYVANGRFDAVILPGGLSLWDVAAAGTIAEAAGALVTDSAGGPWFDVGRASRGTGILASSPAHHETLRGMLRDDHT